MVSDAFVMMGVAALGHAVALTVALGLRQRAARRAPHATRRWP